MADAFSVTLQHTEIRGFESRNKGINLVYPMSSSSRFFVVSVCIS